MACNTSSSGPGLSLCCATMRRTAALCSDGKLSIREEVYVGQALRGGYMAGGMPGIPPDLCLAQGNRGRILHVSMLSRAAWLLPWLLSCLLGSHRALAEGLTSGLTFGGNLVLTSDYIYRGVSASNHDPALQADLHLANAGGTFLGVWGSNRSLQLDPYSNYEIELYLGHRFDLSNAWSVTLSGRAHYLTG